MALAATHNNAIEKADKGDFKHLDQSELTALIHSNPDLFSLPVVFTTPGGRVIDKGPVSFIEDLTRDEAIEILEKSKRFKAQGKGK